MRSFLLICATILVLALALFAYVWFQPVIAEPAAQRMLAANPASRPATTTKISGVGVVQSAWILRIDPKTGELASRFRGDRYDPQPDNSVLVTNPQAEFFSSDGKQRIRIAGRTGRVVLSGADVREAGTFAGKIEPPRRGLLHDVVITLFQPANASEPSATITMNNAAFDNDAFRIETTAFTDADGRTVPADEVPVTVRGKDYDFDGRGLVIAWNERNRELQLLEIEHGERLTIKNLNAINNPKFTASPILPPLATMLVSRNPADAISVAIKSHKRHLSAAQRRRAATRRAEAEAQAARAAATQAARRPSTTLYRASFYDHVRIFEADQRIATADVMNVDFLQGANPTTQPASRPSEHGLRAAPTTTRRTLADSDAVNDDTPTTRPADATQLATRPLQGPITVRWTGKLRVVPLDEAPLPPGIKPNKAIIHLVGNPVTLDRDQSHVVCGAASFNSADQSAEFSSSASVPLVRMSDARGAVVSTSRMIYTDASPREKFATLIGPGSATIPANQPGSTPQSIHASWQDQCKLRLATDAAGRTLIQHAQLTKAVVVDHPQLHLTSDDLGLDFAPAKNRHPTTRNSDNADVELKHIVATGNVHSAIHSADGKTQSLAAERLRVDTATDADHDIYARVIDASGNVVSRADNGKLTTGHLIAFLNPPKHQSTTAYVGAAPASPSAHRPATQPSSPHPFDDNTDLDRLVAEDHVHYATTQGSTATADRLTIQRENDHQRIVLTGTPATVGNPSSTISSNLIRFTPDANLAEIPGPGTLHATSQPSRTASDRNVPGAQSVDISWNGSARINGKANLINIDDGVKVVAHQSDGTIDTTTSNHLIATLMDRPTTQPTTRKSKNSEGALMGDKDIAAARLLGNVRVHSQLDSPGGQLLRGFDLFSQEIDYDKLAGRLVVPVEGKMLYQDYRAGATTQPQGPTIGSGRGATAFEWKKSLVYDERASLATLTGDVAIVHHPDNRKSQPFRLDAQLVTAQFEPAPTTKPATRPASAGGESNLRLKMLTAQDHVHVSSARATFDAFELTFDPINGLLTARGTNDNPGTLYDSATGSAPTFSRLQWNTRTNQFKVTNAAGRLRR